MGGSCDEKVCMLFKTEGGRGGWGSSWFYKTVHAFQCIEECAHVRLKTEGAGKNERRGTDQIRTVRTVEGRKRWWARGGSSCQDNARLALRTVGVG